MAINTAARRFFKGDAMANSDKVTEILRAKGTAMETVEDPLVVAADEYTPPSANREERIREAAYAASERRGFEPGHETDDWLAAEREIDAAGPSGRKGAPGA